MRVMISAAGSPAAASILRHLRSLGHYVIGLDAGRDAEMLGRAFCDEFHVAPMADTQAYLPFLQQRLAGVDIFLPFIDEELLSIAQSWDAIPAELLERIAVSGPGVLQDCLDKCRFQRACLDARLPIAPQATAAPAFFKPRYGRGGKGVIEVCDGPMFDALRPRDGIFQQAIRGREFTVDAIFDREGQLVATSARQRVRAAGVSTMGIVSHDEKLHELARRVGQQWRFKYAINIQVIRDDNDHDWIIELNPRLAGSAIFSALAGCDPFAATIALWKGESWRGAPRALRVWRYWQEMTDAGGT